MNAFEHAKIHTWVIHLSFVLLHVGFFFSIEYSQNLRENWKLNLWCTIFCLQAFVQYIEFISIWSVQVQAITTVVEPGLLGRVLKTGSILGGYKKNFVIVLFCDWFSSKMWRAKDSREIMNSNVTLIEMQVLHIDRNNYYGGASASLNLNQVSQATSYDCTEWYLVPLSNVIMYQEHPLTCWSPSGYIPLYCISFKELQPTEFWHSLHRKWHGRMHSNLLT